MYLNQKITKFILSLFLILSFFNFTIKSNCLFAQKSEMHAATNAEKETLRRGIKNEEAKLEQWKKWLEEEKQKPEWCKDLRNWGIFYASSVLNPIGFMVDEEIKTRPEDEALKIKGDWLKNFF